MTEAPKRSGRLAAVLAATCLAFLSPATAAANGGICQQIEAELAAPTASAEALGYAAAIESQARELQRAHAEARRSACGVPFVGRTLARCGALATAIEKMEDNLESLRRKHSRSQHVAGRARAAILAELEARGCRGNGERLVGRAPALDPMPDDEHGEGRGIDSGPTGNIDAWHNDEAGEAPEARTRRTIRVEGVLGPEFFVDREPKQYRTLCVRLCDGYFFPMSPASSRRDFARDRHNCELACPAARVEIYYHHAMGEESADMVSAVTGAPYDALPAAWVYKQSGAPRPEGCGCRRPAGGFEILAGSLPSPESLSEPRFDPGGHSTPADTAVELGADQLRGTLGAPQGRAHGATSGEGKIRVVGPAFLPGPEEATDWQAPVRKEVP